MCVRFYVLLSRLCKGQSGKAWCRWQHTEWENFHFSVSECMFKVYYITKWGRSLTRSCLPGSPSIYDICIIENKVNPILFNRTKIDIQACLHFWCFIYAAESIWTSIKVFIYFIVFVYVGTLCARCQTCKFLPLKAACWALHVHIWVVLILGVIIGTPSKPPNSQFPAWRCLERSLSTTGKNDKKKISVFKVIDS